MADLNKVSVFARVVEAGGFSAGARALGIPKSSASRSVKQLEDTLGVRLLQRTTRKLRLTVAGQEYYERVASALAGLEEAHAAVTEMQDAPKGVVRLAAPSDKWSWLLPPIIARFVERYPGIRIDVSLTNRELDLVRDGFDLALRMGRLNDSSLIVRTVGSVDCGLFGHQAYIARRGMPERIADLAAHDFIVCRTGDASHRLRLEGPKGTESVMVDGPVAADDMSFVLEAVRVGLGIALLPVSGCVEHLRLVRVLPGYSQPGLTCSVVYPSSRYLPQRVALFRDTLLEELHIRMQNPSELMSNCSSASKTPSETQRRSQSASSAREQASAR